MSVVRGLGAFVVASFVQNAPFSYPAVPNPMSTVRGLFDLATYQIIRYPGTVCEILTQLR